MSGQPFIPGETLHKAFWTRTCLRTLVGEVLLANEESFHVKWEGGSESLPQSAPDGWCRSMDEALGNVLDRLSAGLRRTEREGDVIRAQIQSTRTLQVNLAARAAEGAL